MVGQVSYIVKSGPSRPSSVRSGAGAAVNSILPVKAGNIPIYSDNSGTVIEDSGVPLNGGASYGTTVAVAGVATLNTYLGRVTSEPLTTGPGDIYTLTLNNDLIDQHSIVLANVAQGSNTTEGIVVTRITALAGVVQIVLLNLNFGTAWDGSVVIGFEVLNNLLYGAASAAAGAATLNTITGRITSEPLTTGPGDIYTLVLTNNRIDIDSLVFATVEQGSNTTEGVVVTRVQSVLGQVIIVIQNLNFVTAWNGTIVIGFEVRE